MQVPLVFMGYKKNKHKTISYLPKRPSLFIFLKRVLQHSWLHSGKKLTKKGFAMGMPVTLMRFGVVLKRGEGMLKKLQFPTQYGMGAVIGTGEQPLAWIDSNDLVHAILFLLEHPEITGPINLVAPECVSQKKFIKTLAQALKKPIFLRLPAWSIRFLFGQMGEELLLSGQTVAPQRLAEYQFKFKYPTLLAALTKEFGG